LGHPLNRVVASPAFFEHQCQISSLPENRVAVIRDDEGAVVGVCPIVLWRLTMTLQIRKRVLSRIHVKTATVLSGEPLLQSDPTLFRLLFNGLLEGLPWADCVHINSMPADCPTAHFLYHEDRHKRAYFVHPRRLERREWLYLELGEHLESFLRRKQKRTRNTLKRRVRKLREHGGGRLDCLRIESESEIESFYESALSVAHESWQFHSLDRCLEETALYRESLRNLARLGYLRAYLLRCDGKPCAFVIGYQHEDVLQLQQTAYAREFAQFSPGTVLYYLLLEDLYVHRRPSLVNHGVGVTAHKRLFTNRVAYDTSVYLFRPNLRNRLRCAGYDALSASLNLVKRLLGEPTAVPQVEDDGD
jgi:hypothetical protein